MKPRYSVEFECPNSLELLLELLRYAQVLDISDDGRLTMHCPTGIGRPGNWAASNAERIQSFNLVANSHKKG